MASNQTLEMSRKALRAAYRAQTKAVKRDAEENLRGLETKIAALRLQSETAVGEDAAQLLYAVARLEKKAGEERTFLAQAGIMTLTYYQFLLSKWEAIKDQMLGAKVTDALLDEREAVEAEWDANFPGEPLDDDDGWEPEENYVRAMVGVPGRDI